MLAIIKEKARALMKLKRAPKAQIDFDFETHTVPTDCVEDFVSAQLRFLKFLGVDKLNRRWGAGSGNPNQ